MKIDLQGKQSSRFFFFELPLPEVIVSFNFPPFLDSAAGSLRSAGFLMMILVPGLLKTWNEFDSSGAFELCDTSTLRSGSLGYTGYVRENV
jgi:hypothetical protein